MSGRTLADKISGILNAAPDTFDPEDDTVDDTKAKLQKDFEQEDDIDDEDLLGKFRTQNSELLEDVDQKYAGKKGSRKYLNKSFSDEDLSENQETDSETSNDSNKECSDEEQSEEVDNDDSEDYEGDEDQNENNNTGGSDFKHFEGVNVKKQISKGICVRNQMNIWENLLEIRIQLQKCLIPSNKMPQSKQFMEIKQNSTEEFVKKASETKNTLIGLLDKLITFQDLVLNKYPETINLEKEFKEVKADSDEEIPSDTDNEDVKEEKSEEEIPRKKLKLNEYEHDISDRHKTYRNYRNQVIQKWNDKTRIASLKQTSTHNILSQIDYILNDKTRLIKRTQLKRSNYEIIGQDQTNSSEHNEHNEEYNKNIFDDDDFYHQLLRELIEVKSSDITDPVQLGRQWIQLQNLRNKMKRKIDTKATKGRKIRYAIHNKLVNFMTPIDDNLWTEDAKNELFLSLFGKKR